MFQIKNNVAYINGLHGKYGKEIQNPSVRYGRNSVANYQSYIDSFKTENFKLPNMDNLKDLSDADFYKKMDEINAALRKVAVKKAPPVDFECQYMPTKFDSMALMGAAYEEMGQKLSVSTSKLTSSLQKTIDEMMESLHKKEKTAKKAHFDMSAEALDLNYDGRIDLAEYSASILATDALSSSQEELSSKNINGIYSNKGENASMALYVKSNYKISNEIFKKIYSTYELDKVQEEFLKDGNNLI